MVCDVFDLKADICVFGRNRPFRERVEALVGNEFSPYQEVVDGRCAEILDCSCAEVPWSRAVSYLYTARCFSPLEGPRPSEIHHLRTLREDLHFLLHEIVYDFNPVSIAVLGLSWRNPEVVAFATVAAISELIGSLAGDARLFPGHLRSYDLLKPVKLGEVHLKSILLVDHRSTDIFVRAITNADNCLTVSRVCDTPYRTPLRLSQ